MKPQSNILQKIIIRGYMLPVFTKVWVRIQHHLDAFFFRISKNRYSLTGILGGVSVVQLISLGAKTGRQRTTPLIGLFVDKKLVLIGSNYGQANNPGWYYNLKAHPECKVLINGISSRYFAIEATEETYREYWELILSYHSGYERYRWLASNRHIPVMVLEPKE